MTSMDDQNICCRRILSSMIAVQSSNTGFVEIQTPALETLTEVLGACKKTKTNEMNRKS